MPEEVLLAGAVRLSVKTTSISIDAAVKKKVFMHKLVLPDVFMLPFQF